ncbi:hypothetical protein EYF80_044308 [Liparis tanakae]|uniref:Uncharacterized protein n=1 Tax=Liparis tanakae TaxID=230148 RepID=A0A4Z2FX24_9TELE|nr:hypothetical protein EYF80_044308 [Liparis tanakae]
MVSARLWVIPSVPTPSMATMTSPWTRLPSAALLPGVICPDTETFRSLSVSTRGGWPVNFQFEEFLHTEIEAKNSLLPVSSHRRSLPLCRPQSAYSMTSPGGHVGGQTTAVYGATGFTGQQRSRDEATAEWTLERPDKRPLHVFSDTLTVLSELHLYLNSSASHHRETEICRGQPVTNMNSEKIM